MDENSGIALDAVSRRFGDQTVVDRISLALDPGLILGIIGPSGAGKTTTIRLLTGALAPSEGTVRVLGEDPRRYRRRTRERLGYMPQQFSLYEDLTTVENVDFVASMFGMLAPRRRRRIPEILKLIDLWPARSRQAGKLSGGMQRRLQLACALVHDPLLVFLDEPTAGIDPLLRERIWAELHRRREAGRTLVVTTQYVTEAEECDVVALIDEGHLVALGRPEELRRTALGGEVVEIETAAPVPLSALVEREDVIDGGRVGPNRYRLVVEDAAEAIPAIVDGLTASGAEVSATREERVSFEEVFSLLVRRSRGQPSDPGTPETESDAEAAA
ncbi:MAG TPA: ABC transporter ATP-binding protein [Candidatus Limnocylindrales bacterium]